MEEQWTPPAKACIDLTLIWGADSYLSARSDVPSDPWGKRSFRNLIDVSLGTRDVFFPIPEDDNDVSARVFGSALNRGAALPGTSYKSAPLTPAIEAAVVEGFGKVLSNLDSRTRLAEWLAFQLSIQRFESHVGWKGSKRQPITPDGAGAWTGCRDEMLGRAKNLQIVIDEDDLTSRYAVSDIASSAHEFVLLYAFDGYRRGWQYADYAAGMSSVYFPHRLRDDCLNSGGASWRTIEKLSGLSLSWSQYFLNLIDEDPSYRNSLRIGQLLARVREAQQEEPAPPWTHIGISELMRTAERREQGARLYAMLAHLTRIAERAKLPLLRKKPDSLSEKALALLGSHLLKLGTDGNPIVAPLMWFFEGVEKTIKLIPAGKVWVEEKEGAIPQMLFRGRYAYRGLVPLTYQADMDDGARRY
jgi:hypothetical protein